MFKPRWLIPLIAVACLSSIVVAASPAPSASQAGLLPSNGDKKYRAVGRFKGSLVCTGTLVAGSATPSPAAAALVLTAGHCVNERLGANEVVVDEAVKEAWTYTPAYFRDTQPGHRPFAVDRVRYATMKGVDLAVVQLKTTYGDLARWGVYPLTVASPQRLEGMPIELVHAPVSEVPDDEQFLRLSRCVAEKDARIFEGYSPWFWTSTTATHCAGVAGGSSGGPVLADGTASVLGVMGTRVDPALLGCGANRPCEPADGTPFSREGANYFHSAGALASALGADGQWDDIDLDAGNGVVLERAESWITQSRVEEEGHLVPAYWGVRVGGATRWIRYKTGPAATLDCDRIEGYGEAIEAARHPLDRLTVPAQEGVYALCVIGRMSEAAAWQRTRDATRLLHRIDDTPPTIVPRIVVFDESGTAWQVYGEKQPYEVVGFKIKYGPRDRTDCQADDGYFIPASFWQTLSKKEAPWRFCARGEDDAKNRSPVASRDFE